MTLLNSKTMINANELRIGNIVAIKDQEKYIVGEPNEYAVTDIGDRVGLVNRGKQQWGIEEIKPIKLNEEWLLKFGFGFEINEYITLMFNCPEKEIAGCFFRLFTTKDNSICDLWLINETSVNPDDKCLKDGILLKQKIQYVHQLQNLYYALTGEELTIK